MIKLEAEPNAEQGKLQKPKHTSVNQIPKGDEKKERKAGDRHRRTGSHMLQFGLLHREGKSQTLEVTDVTNKSPVLVWDQKVPGTQLEKFKKTIEKKYSKHFESYWELHKWSTENFEKFWEEIWKYAGVIYSEPFEQVYRKTGDGFLDCEWFPGAKFNFAENILRIRDDRLALICADEYGSEETVTYCEMFEEVKLYAAAFKKHGLKNGDRVACYMSNRKEAIFAFLAASSMGAIFGGPQPYFGYKPAANIIQKMEPKFLIVVDHHQDLGVEYNNINSLPYIVDNSPTLETVIIVPSTPNTLTRNISNIRNSYFLEDFLNSGRLHDGTVPDIVFEQLPFSHPLSIHFTSGTTDLPKGPVHSAGTILSLIANDGLHWNIKSGDVLHTCYPVGWTLWDMFIPFLTRGVTLFLYAGNMMFEKHGSNVWDIFSKFKVTHSCMVTAYLDKLEKSNIIPGPNVNLDNLKFITVGGSPTKPHNFMFVHNKIKKDVFVCGGYGATESFGSFTAYDFNLPCYAGELQVPALGMDLRCFDAKGNSVMSKRGDMVLATPTPALPICVWGEKDNRLLEEIYLSKHSGVWCQLDEIWINPNTNGIVVVGRSDDSLKQSGVVFAAGDIYSGIHDLQEIQDSICVGQKSKDGESRAVLFIKMKNGYPFTTEFKEKVKQKIADELCSNRVPEVILEIEDIPYSLNNKKMERVIRKTIAENKIPDVISVKNPECLRFYCDIPEIMNYGK